MKNIPETIIVEHCGNDHLEPIFSITDNVRGGFHQTSGGLWTSPVDSVNGWREWCKREDFHIERLEKSFRMEISTKHLLVIDSLDDLIDKMVWPHILEFDSLCYPFIHWDRLVSMYNGVWVTARGIEEIIDSYPYKLYGCYCETVLLFNEKPIIRVLDE